MSPALLRRHPPGVLRVSIGALVSVFSSDILESFNELTWMETSEVQKMGSSVAGILLLENVEL